MELHDTQHVERAVLAQLVTAKHDPAESADSLLELARLADTAGLEVAGQITQNREKPDGGTMFGSGKVTDLKNLAAEFEANTVIFDNPINAIQAYNLTRALPGVRVMDRTEVILQIFARRARSAEAQVQVELAQLEFQLSRIPVLEAQQRFKGGIGMKGPGESHLQLRNAPIRRRISELRKRLADIQARRTATSRRDKREMPVVSMVGYTNAGKSTLLNALAGADAYVDDRLFATLDTKTRRVWLSKARQLLLTDTVGFIRHLPHGLVASFKSTLDVAVQADLLMIVVDAAYPRVDDHIRICDDTLREIGAHDVPHILVLNKCDRGTADTALLHVTEKYPHAIPVSAKTGYGLGVLKQALTQELQKCCTLWRLPSATSRT
ncbi:MAG: GTPase HflX [Kiritimatiellaeota bacterium]|nr:GTPase HflX [Kiritimatiellota bacterium]